ncbi:hypothetical protein Tco_0755288 [Tanacetum coccineum]
MASQDSRLSKFEADFKQQQSEMTNKIDTVLKAITDRIAGTLPSDKVKNPKLSTTPVLSARQEKKGNLGNINSNQHPQPDPLASITTEQVRRLNLMLESLGLVPQSSNTKFVCSKEDDGDVNDVIVSMQCYINDFGDFVLRVYGKCSIMVIRESLRREKLYAKFSKLGDALSRKERVKSRRVRGMILAAQSKAFKQENVLVERLHGLDQQMERKGDESLYFMDRIWVLLVGSVIDEAHASSLRYLSENEIESPWILSLNFQGQSNNSKEWNSGDDQLRLRWMIYLVVLADAAESVRDAIGFEYCLASSSGWTKSPVLWAEIGESSLTGLELVQETTDKVVLVKEKPKAARDRQKSYVDYRRKPLEFEVGDRVLLKVTPWKGVVCFGKKGKLAPRYVGPFEILERIGLVAYRLRLPKELNSVHDTFYVSNMKKCLADANLHVPLDEIKVDKTLHFVEEPVEIMDREIKKLKRRKIAPVKVRWNSKRGPELVIPLEMAKSSFCVISCVLCVYVCVYVDYVGVGTQSIERDRLIGIGVVLDNSFRSLLSDEEMIIEI